ncbi:pyruvate carboxylase [Papillibacter cinnamivorans]|uniref:Pyruvate carboxylase n=1 Tax=Papillibacter cinnamivorans DSM 12816 TaxID=1122930 RepID=A0A1W2BV35_9FIRM|nr:pyruvate carboxylase [Papillibacter cinnamivorans]SMC76586.1 pyruvate carboxylase [Papillibacter cinnamivorans DSM 12816]
MAQTEVKDFKKVLVANRGEIAIRIFRACYDLGLNTVAIYSKEDVYNLFRTKADESYQVDESHSPLGAYLDIDWIIAEAKRRGADAIHPGYGFLSENPNFAKACEDNGIKFIGPPSSVLAQMGDKLNAKAIAIRCGVPIIPGSTVPLKDGQDALEKAVNYGFPVILKAAAGGGGRGMRRCSKPEEVIPAFDLVRSEAKKAFGNDDIFIEKFIEEPKHVEVQILADEHGNVVHLYERDCSLQRRYQKVVEFTPAFAVPEETRKKLYADAVKIAKEVGYINAGTVEFLVDKSGNHFFIEMNPRIQVEHTVTEMVTGIDLVRAQILIAEGKPLSTPEIGIKSQNDVKARGYSIQCRITTEDPQNNFAPDTGKITAYRSGGGYGVRLDAGNAYSGAEISPYYDSLLVKITTIDNTFEGACRKALRSISETRVRGVKTNMAFISNILSNPTFRAGKCHTKFIDETPELFKIEDSQDRATKMLKYIANIVVNDPTAGRKLYETPRFPKVTEQPRPGLKQMLDKEGPEAVQKWVLAQKKLLVCDTTMRDAHQSLLATRVRTRDMVKGAEGMADALADAFSLEMWGGATFDVAYRFLHEDPWERIDLLREKIPNILFQMLLRGANAVGYTNYPDNLIREFIREAAKSGIDVFRIFDSLNWIPGMEIAIDEVLKCGKIAEASICYTGDILDPSRDKYTVKYYVDMAKELEKRGAHTLCIKDMSGLIKPYAAKKLVTALKNEIGIPVHLHTHDTSGNQVAALLMAAEAGVDIVDVAISSMSSLTSQPSMNAVVAALERQERDTGLDLQKLQGLTDYWSDIRERYDVFEAGIKSPATDIYRYEIPGGQYTNLKPQVESLGLGHRFDEVKEKYKTVNDMLGDIVKVTPSSKMVGDLAIFMVQNDLTPENIVSKGENLTFPDSVVSYFKGMMGQPAWGFPEDLQRVVLKGVEPIRGRPGELLPPVDFEAARKTIEKFQHNPTWRDILSWCLYPKVLEDYFKTYREHGYIMRLGSHVYFHGLAVGETNKVNIEDGKTLVIKYLGLGDLNPDGTRNVQFELNGARREVAVPDNTAPVSAQAVTIADPEDKSQIGASIPGAVSKVMVKAGDAVKENQVLAVIEAMKMETSVVARMDGVIKEVFIKPGQSVKAGELLIVMK